MRYLSVCTLLYICLFISVCFLTAYKLTNMNNVFYQNDVCCVCRTVGLQGDTDGQGVHRKLEYDKKSGLTCQNWTSNIPHSHPPFDRSDFLENNLDWVYNYCRNPDNSTNGPWCYTTSPGTVREDCQIDYCGTPHFYCIVIIILYFCLLHCFYLIAL